jgi:DHA3 family macrolide efflux protein-like MFS transporter
MKRNTIINHNPVFFNIWIAHLISMFGDVFYDVAIVWYLVERTESALLAGGIAIFSLLGKFLGAAIVSQRIDIYKTRHIMIWVDFLRGVILIGVLISMYSVKLPIVAFYILSGVISFLTACFTPARSKSITEIVPSSELTQANSFDGISGAIVQILSWILGGFVVATFGVFFALVLDTISFFLSLFFVLKSNWKSVVSSEEKEKSRIQIIEGMKIITKNKILRDVLMFELFYMGMMGFYWAALPIKINEIGNAFYYGFQGAAFGVGFLITSVYLSRKRIVNIGEIYIAGLIVHLVGNFGAGISSYISLFIFGVFIGGLGNSYWQVAKTTIIQINTEISDLGKVLTILEMFTSICLIPAWILGGYLADKYSPTIVMMCVGLAQMIAIALLVAYKPLRGLKLDSNAI